ncbi:MAG: diguanylate cyclase, partial [Methylococcaceae bacterium]|nr:diguanylate cyclase [Methylococcaceae bacterium]
CALPISLDMREFIHIYNKQKNLQLSIRIGIHTGPVIAGIIGTKKFSYDLWGDAVNLASRMESHALPGKIQVTKATYLLLKKEFDFEERGLVEIKGKGEMQTYFLEGHKA